MPHNCRRIDCIWTDVTNGINSQITKIQITEKNHIKSISDDGPVDLPGRSTGLPVDLPVDGRSTEVDLPPGIPNHT